MSFMNMPLLKYVDEISPRPILLMAGAFLGERIVALHDATGQIDYITCGHGGYLDFERLMPDATLLRCSEFGDAIIRHMD